MVDEKITDYAALTGLNLATNDLFEMVDVSDTSMDATGTNKKMTGSELAVGVRALGSDFVYGDGSDGTVTFDGTTTILGMAPSSSVYTATRDLHLAAGTLNNGVTLKMAGYRLFCAGTLTNNGTISNNGANGSNGVSGSGGAPGANGPSGTIFVVGIGGGTGSINNGVVGGNRTSSFGGNGGAGGNGGTGTAGGAGTATAPAASIGTLRDLPTALVGASLFGSATATWLNPGAGGGGGGGDATNGGGGGATGGGALIVAARNFAGTGSVLARGGTGGNGFGTGNTGGGGGGGGGWLVVISASVSGGAISGQTVDANGGSGGTKNGTGVAGSAGSNGTAVLIAN